jgi:hypothetical protein
MSSRQQRSVKSGSSAEDARAQRMRNTVELRKQKTDDKMKRLRNIDVQGGDTIGVGGDCASSVSTFIVTPRKRSRRRPCFISAWLLLACQYARDRIKKRSNYALHFVVPILTCFLH